MTREEYDRREATIDEMVDAKLASEAKARRERARAKVLAELAASGVDY